MIAEPSSINVDTNGCLSHSIPFRVFPQRNLWTLTDERHTFLATDKILFTTVVLFKDSVHEQILSQNQRKSVEALKTRRLDVL